MGGRSKVLSVAVLTSLVLATGVAGAAGTLFQPYSAVDVGSWPEAVAMGDVTGDGRTDVVMTTGYYFDPANDFRLWVFAQTESGALAPPVSYATGFTRTPESVRIGDLTGDGLADVVVGLDEVGLQVYPQLASGSLGSPAFYPTPDGNIVRLGHLDGDALLDVAAIGWGTNTVSVLLNDGAGGLRAPVQYPAQHAGWDDLELGDVTGDGLEDIVVMSGQTYAVPNLSVLAQLPSGGFGQAAEYRVGTNINTNGVGVGELTGDGRLDVVASYGGNRPSSNLALFPQVDGGTLGDPIVYASYDIPSPVEVADVDLDGRSDVLTLHGGWNRAGVYLQQVGGGLAAEDLYAIPYASSYGSSALAVGDVSGDGRPDVALADYNHGLVVLSSEPAEPPPPPPPPPPVADVAVDVTASSARVKPKKAFWFDVVVRNNGPDATAASLVVQLGSGPTSVGTTGTGCTVQAATVNCSLPSLAAGASVTVSVTGTAPSKGTVTGAASVDGAADDPNPVNDDDSAAIAVR